MVIINPDIHVEPELLLHNRVWEKYAGTQGAHLGISGDSKPDNHCTNSISQPWFDESKVTIYPMDYKERSVSSHWKSGPLEMLNEFEAVSW